MSPGHYQPSALVDMGEVHEGFIDASSWDFGAVSDGGFTTPAG